MKPLLILLISLFVFESSFAKINVVTTTTDLQDLITRVGGEFVHVESIAKGTQDIHSIEAKPSFMVKMKNADLLVSVGLDLEKAWLVKLLEGSRNPKIRSGEKGYLELGPSLRPIEVQTGSRVSRAEGDVHLLGNPHFWLDPIRMGEAAILAAQKLSELDTENKEVYLKNAEAFQAKLELKTKEWKKRIELSGVRKVITYHKTLNYFFDRFGIENPMSLEPKPGIPPTSGHILNVIKQIQSQHIPLVLIENYYDPTVGNRIKSEVPSVKIKVVAVSVRGEKGINSLEELYEQLVSAIQN